MKATITSITLPVDLNASLGLGPLELRDLKDIVAIAGPNGAGKTRLLHCIATAASSSAQLRPQRKQLVSLEKQIASTEKLISSSPADPDITALRTRRDEIARQMAPYADLDVAETGEVSVIWLGAKREHPHNINNATLRQLDAAELALGPINSILNLLVEAKRVIWKVSDNYLSATHPDLKDAADSEKARTRYEALRSLIRTLLGTELQVTSSHRAMLFGKPLDDANLSEGQMILLQFAAALFAVDDQSPCVVLLDEPENHLHPAAQIDLIDQLQKVLPNGQIFLATHSLPLLAHLGAERILVMKDGRISKRASKDVQDVLITLMGDEKNIGRMRDFVDEPELLAAIDFATQCLLPPGTQPPETGDPQQAQMVQALQDLWKQGRPTRVLDWGAGQGRLAAALNEHLRGQGMDPASSVAYYAFNPMCTEEDRSACLNAMAALDPNGVEERFLATDLARFTAFRHDKADVIVMCNVLHEIPAHNWVNLFIELGSTLADDGHLLVIEDLEIPHGEMAFREGFFLMDKGDMAELLGTGPNAFRTATDPNPRYKDRLVCYTVPKPLLEGVTGTTLCKALRGGRKAASIKLRELRGMYETAPPALEWERRLHGRRHALYAQQIANASEFLGDLQ